MLNKQVIFGENEQDEVVNVQPSKAAETLFVNEFTDGILSPHTAMPGPLKDGGTIIANTAPGSLGTDDNTGNSRWA